MAEPTRAVLFEACHPHGLMPGVTIYYDPIKELPEKGYEFQGVNWAGVPMRDFVRHLVRTFFKDTGFFFQGDDHDGWMFVEIWGPIATDVLEAGARMLASTLGYQFTAGPVNL